MKKKSAYRIRKWKARYRYSCDKAGKKIKKGQFDTSEITSPGAMILQVGEDEEPIREELFSIERLEQYAATLAYGHQVSERPRRGRVLLPRFEENGRYLIAAYRKLTKAVFEGQVVSPAAEWLSRVPRRPVRSSHEVERNPNHRIAGRTKPINCIKDHKFVGHMASPDLSTGFSSLIGINMPSPGSE